ncbi:unnamed protein product [Closterium sp. NIES-65]|nr:unnamed protein product [Closterium sp. NIES-65]
MAVASHSISHIAGLSVPPSVQSKQPRHPVRARAGPIRPSTRASAELNASRLPLLFKAPALQSSSLAGAHRRSRSRSRKGVSSRALPVAAAAAATAAAETKEQLEAKAERFWKWLVDQGVGDKDLPAAVKPAVLTAADGQPRLALVADRDIRSGDDLLLVPLSACLTLDKVLRTDIGAVCGDVRPWVALALFIIRERGNPTSEWAPYLDTLPATLNSPLLCHHACIHLLFLHSLSVPPFLLIVLCCFSFSPHSRLQVRRGAQDAGRSPTQHWGDVIHSSLPPSNLTLRFSPRPTPPCSTRCSPVRSPPPPTLPSALSPALSPPPVTQVLALQQQYAEYIAAEHQAALDAIVLPNPALFLLMRSPIPRTPPRSPPRIPPCTTPPPPPRTPVHASPCPRLCTRPRARPRPLPQTLPSPPPPPGTQVLALQQQYAEYIAAEHQAALDAVVLPNPALFPDPSRFSLAAFTWAFALLRARSFPPFSRDDVALVPLLDLVSHSTESPEGKWQARAVGGGLFSAGKDVVTGPAGRSFHKGQLITVNFGKSKSNAQLAIDHGIVDPPTITPASSSPASSSSSSQAPQQEQQKSGALGAIVNTVASGVNNVTSMVSVGKAVAAVEAAKVAAKAAAAAAATGAGNRDAFSLTLEIAESDRFFYDKADIAEQSGLEAVADFDIVAGQGVPDEMVAFLRLVALGGADAFLLEALFRNSVWDHLLNPVSRENEEAVCVGIVDSCAAALAAYPTTYEEDVALLPTLAEGSKEQVAVVVRMGEKAALGELQSWAVRRMRALDSLLYYAERRLSDLGLLDDTGNMTPWVGVE